MSAEPNERGLPVTLHVRGWPCLVVGGGPVAARKAGALCASGAQVRVVAPSCCAEMERLVTREPVEYRDRRFEPADVAGMRLVFAATNDSGVNREVVRTARAAHALCCCVDGNWRDGDLTTPAVMEQAGLLVSVSTSGQSCRRAKMVKATLGRHLEAIGTADLLVLGTSHEQLRLEEREPVQLVGDRLLAAGRMLMQVWGIHEFLLLVTCNRIELVAVASRMAAGSGLLERIMGLDSLRDDQRYCLLGRDAFEHVALVTAGICSQSPGEYHVAAQVKAALATAIDNGWAGAMLSAWTDTALHISKHIKNEVVGGLALCEIEEVAIQFVVDRLGADWRDLTVMVVGSGMVGKALVTRVLERGARCLWCYHHNRPDPDAQWRGRVGIFSMNGINENLLSCDLVYCAVDTVGAVLHGGHAPFFDQERRVHIVDLGIPRAVSPDLPRLLPEAELFNLDALKSWSARHDGTLAQAVAKSKAIIGEHHDDYTTLIHRFQGRNPVQ